MKKISYFIITLTVVVSFGIPSLASAQPTTCPSGCSIGALSGQCVDSGGEPCSASGTFSPTSGTQGNINKTYLDFYYYLVLTVVNSYLVPVLIAIAFIVFLWGIYKAFIWNAASESDKAEGRKFAMWGIIGFVIITSLWGIVNIVKGTVIPSSAGSNRPAYPTL